MHTDDGGDLSAPWRAGCSARSAACVAVHSSASTAPSRRRSSASRRPSRDTSTWRKMAAMSRKAARLKRHGGVGYDGVAADPPPPLNRSLGWTQHGPSKDAIKKNHKKTYKNIYKKTQNPQNKKTANPQKKCVCVSSPPPAYPPSLTSWVGRKQFQTFGTLALLSRFVGVRRLEVGSQTHHSEDSEGFPPRQMMCG